jgi:hypothetical protein
MSTDATGTPPAEAMPQLPLEGLNGPPVGIAPAAPQKAVRPKPFKKAQPPRPAHEPGSQPLRDWQHEEFSKLIAEGTPAIDAWIMVGWSASSNNSARTAKKAQVAARIEYLRREFNNRQTGDGRAKLQWLQRKYLDIVLADPTKFAERDAAGNFVLRDPSKVGSVATKFKIDATGRLEFELDRRAALDSLTKTVGGFTNRLEMSGPDGGPVEVEGSTVADRAKAVALLLAEAGYTSEAPAHAQALPPDGGAPESPLEIARRVLRAAGQAAQAVVTDSTAAEFLASKLQQLSDAIRQEAARAAARAGAGHEEPA